MLFDLSERGAGTCMLGKETRLARYLKNDLQFLTVHFQIP